MKNELNSIKKYNQNSHIEMLKKRVEIEHDGWIREIEINRAMVVKLESMAKLLQYNFTNKNEETKLVIYGMGVLGVALYNKLKDNFFIEEFLDKEPRGFDGICTNTLENAKGQYDENTTVIVTPIQDYDEIYKEIRWAKGCEVKIYRIDDFISEICEY